MNEKKYKLLIISVKRNILNILKFLKNSKSLKKFLEAFQLKPTREIVNTFRKAMFENFMAKPHEQNQGTEYS